MHKLKLKMVNMIYTRFYCVNITVPSNVILRENKSNANDGHH
jgi:hypothetical protein